MFPRRSGANTCRLTTCAHSRSLGFVSISSRSVNSSASWTRPQCGSSSWVVTSGATRPAGHSRAPARHGGSCAPAGSLDPNRRALGTRPQPSRRPFRPCSDAGRPRPGSPRFPPGAFDQSRVESRTDLCVFTSELLQEDLEVTGPVRLVLNAQSTAPSTDWVGRLCDVHPDGRSFNVCDGIVRIADGADEYQQVEIDLWSTSIVFLAGHRLRVHVTSSSFPRWDRNLNPVTSETPGSRSLISGSTTTPSVPRGLSFP